MHPTPPLTLIDLSHEGVLVKAMFDRWHEALRHGAQPLGNTMPGSTADHERWRLAGGGPQLKLLRRGRAVPHVGDYEQATFRWTLDNPSGGWIVQVNRPPDNGGQSRLALDAADNIWILRRGQLKQNGMTPGLNDKDFTPLMAPLVVQRPDGSADPGAWYAVAMPDADLADVVAMTTAFVRSFTMVRQMHAHASGNAVPLQGAAEPTEPFWMPPKAGQLLQQKQGKVLDRLLGLLGTAGITKGKLPSLDGLSCDLWVEAPGGPLLIEIKTATTAADIHMGIGQLTLYPEIFRTAWHLPFGDDYRRVLLLPGGKVNPSQLAAATNLGFAVHRYEVYGNWESNPLDVEFSASFLQLCGLAAS